jgi:hypothetical protein
MANRGRLNDDSRLTGRVANRQRDRVTGLQATVADLTLSSFGPTRIGVAVPSQIDDSAFIVKEPVLPMLGCAVPNFDGNASRQARGAATIAR